MVGRRLKSIVLLAGGLAVTGCHSNSGEQSYELVEAPKPSVAATPGQTEVALQGRDLPAAPPATRTDQIPEGASGGPGARSDTSLAAVPDVPPVPAAAATAPSPSLVEPTSLVVEAGKIPPLAMRAEPLTPSKESIAKLVPNKIELKVPHKDFDREGRERALRISYDDIDLLKVLNMEPVPLDAEQYLPDWLKRLNGETVRLRGWMFPPLMTEGLPAFLFVRDNQICCFGREAKVYDKVRVTLKDGVTTDYIFGRPFDVVGKFRIESEERDGELYFLYSIDDAVVMK